MENALITGFQRIIHRVRPVPVGSRLRVTRYRHFSGVCCVDGIRAWLAGVKLCSDGEGEFGEGHRDLLPRVCVHAEFVVAAANILDERVSGTDHPS